MINNLCLFLQVLSLIITIGIIARFSWEISKVKFLGLNKIQHNHCYTDNINVEMTQGNEEPHI